MKYLSDEQVTGRRDSHPTETADDRDEGEPRRSCSPMTEGIETKPGLVKLSDSELILKDQTQDIRGLHVYDSNGEQVGGVDDLYVDEQECEVRLLDVAAGGFLGVGEKHFLIPVETVTEVGEESLTVDPSRQKGGGFSAV